MIPSLRVLRIACLSVFLLLAARTPASCGVVDLSWSLCLSPVVSHRQVADGVIVPLFVYVDGQAEPFSGSFVRVAVSRAGGGPLADAWRFDTKGCQAGGFSAFGFNPAFGKCPTLRGSLPSSEFSSYEYDAFNQQAEFSHVQQLGSVRSVDPAVRQQAVVFRFDHQFSTLGPGTPEFPCGNLADLVCLRIVSAGFVTESGSSVEWTRGEVVATAAGPGISPEPCVATDSRPTTWGMIKSIYRP